MTRQVLGIFGKSTRKAEIGKVSRLATLQSMKHIAFSRFIKTEIRLVCYGLFYENIRINVVAVTQLGYENQHEIYEQVRILNNFNRSILLTFITGILNLADM